MAIQTTSNLTNPVGTRYTTAYLEPIGLERFYDQFAMEVDAPQFQLENRKGLGTTYTFHFLSDMTPGSTAISETTDVVPQVLRDATSTISTTSRGEALKWSQLLDLQVYTNYVAERAKILGRNWVETVDNQAKAAVLQGNLVIRAAARASLDAGTAGHTLTSSSFHQAATLAQQLRMPSMTNSNGEKRGLAGAHTDVFYDMINSNNILSVALYQDKEILFNGEIGIFAGFKIIASPWAKIFLGAGADNASNADTTLNGAVNALALTAVVASSSNISVGRTLAIGTEETGNTHYDTNEPVKWVSGTTTITVTGTASNGGLRFDHASGESVRNADNVYPVVYGNANSAVKVYATETGPYGKLVGPDFDGILKQWQYIGYKWYGGYGRPAENYLLRGEYSSALQA